MPTSDVVGAPEFGAAPKVGLKFDTQFARVVVIVNGAVPLALLAWDTVHHQLGINAVNFAIHTTGTLALAFLLLSLTVTPLRLVTGMSEIIAVRRALGLYGFFYLCVHFAIFFGFDRAASVSSTLHEIWVRRYLQVGTLALVMLIPLAVTSTNAMVRRLGARRWKQLHRLVYFAAALGSVHYVLLVKADLRQPLAFAAALGLLLGFRVVHDRRAAGGRPKGGGAKSKRAWSGNLDVLRITDETPDVKTFRLGLENGAPLPFRPQPGQYLNLAIEIDGERVNRSYTIAAAPEHASFCEITVKRLPEGRASRHLHDTLRKGSVLAVSAPAGRFVFTGEGAKAVVLIAAGVGITPLMAMVRALTDHAWSGDIHLLFSVHDRHDVIFANELQLLRERWPNLHVTMTLTGASTRTNQADSSAWNGETGRITADLITRAVPNLKDLPIYLCGPDAMMLGTRLLLAALGVPEDHVHTETFISRPTAARSGATGAVAAAGDASASATEAPVVSFRRSLQMAEPTPGQTVLEAAEDAGVEIPFECRSGICGQCKTRLLEGRVIMDVEDALSTDEKAEGLILACQAHALTDVAIDA